MSGDYWLARWERGETGFHQDAVNASLQRFWPRLRCGPGDEVFVPLCGKTGDMLWLRRQGCRVLGVELSGVAIRAFFEEAGLAPRRIPLAGDGEDGGFEAFEVFEADGIRLLRGDCFDLTDTHLAGMRAVYDRAALIALPPGERARYAGHLLRILPSAAPILLVTLDYPQPEMEGPPFAVSAAEVEALYGGHGDVRLLVQQDILSGEPRFQARGLSWLRESAFLVEPRRTGTIRP